MEDVMVSRIFRGITKDKSVRIYVVDSTEMVEEARIIHQCTPVSIAALGRVISAASIMGRMLKDEKESLTLQIKGSGEIKSIVAVSNFMGDVKAYVSNPYVVLPHKENGKLDVGGAVGNDGSVIVSKDIGLKTPFIGQSNLISGEIGDDIAGYFMNSEQQPSVVSVGVFIGEDGSVKSSGGIIIQPLPFAEEEVIEKIEKSIEGMKSASTLILENDDLFEIAKKALKEFEVEVMDEREVKLYCDCSLERIEKALVSIGKDELTNIIEEDGGAEISCHFCNKKYKFQKEDLERLIESI